MAKHKINKIWRGEQKSKDGRTFQKIGIKIDAHGDKWVGGFQGRWNESWKEGEEHDITIEEKGQYLNLVAPKSGGSMILQEMNKKLDKIMELLGDNGLKDDTPENREGGVPF